MKRVLSIIALLAIVLSTSAFYLISKGKKDAPSDGVERKYKSKPVKKPALVKICDGIEYKVTAKGNGPMAKDGDGVKVLYKGMLTNDTVFDASYLHGNQPFTFHLGKREVISGWDSVMLRAHAGDKIRMTLAPQYGYGARANGKIPANSTLVFEVEVLDIISAPTPWDAKGKDTITTASGMKIVWFETHPDSAMPKAGQKVSVHYSGFLLNGKLFDSSVEKNMPLPFMLGRGQVIKGWDEGIAMMHKGDKAKFIIPASLAYGNRGNGMIPPGATLMFDVQLVDIMMPPKPWDAKGKDTITTASGLKIVYFEKHPEAPMAGAGKNVSVQYSGFLTDGTLFDSSVERGQPYSFQCGMGRVIKGWDEGIALLHKGEKAKLIVPPSLGYGQNANGKIPPNSTLIFDVMLVDVK